MKTYNKDRNKYSVAVGLGVYGGRALNAASVSLKKARLLGRYVDAWLDVEDEVVVGKYRSPNASGWTAEIDAVGRSFGSDEVCLKTRVGICLAEHASSYHAKIENGNAGPTLFEMVVIADSCFGGVVDDKTHTDMLASAGLGAKDVATFVHEFDPAETECIAFFKAELEKRLAALQDKLYTMRSDKRESAEKLRAAYDSSFRTMEDRYKADRASMIKAFKADISKLAESLGGENVKKMADRFITTYFD